MPTRFLDTPTEAWAAFWASIALTFTLYLSGMLAGWITSFNYFEIGGVALNFACVYLVGRQNNWTWPFGIIAVILLGVLFWQLGLYASMLLHFGYFLPIQFWGWYVWVRGSKTGQPLTVTQINYKTVTTLVIVSTIVVYAISMAFGGEFALADTAIYGLSVTAQLLMTYKKIESWLLWIAVNVIAIIVYTSAGSTLLGIQYTLFLANALYGIWAWKQSIRANTLTEPT